MLIDRYLNLFSALYDEVVRNSTVIVTLFAISFFVIACLTSVSKEGRGNKGRACLFSLSFLLILSAAGYFHNKGDISSVLITVGASLFLISEIKSPSSAFGSKVSHDLAPLWQGLLIILLSLGVKCLWLASWPPDIHPYVSITLVKSNAALRDLNFSQLFWARRNDLVYGGFSLPHSLILWPLIWRFGISIFTPRLAEVIGSTFALLFFFLWVRRRLPGRWAILSLALFGFSSWHIAESRFGTYQSLTLAFAISMLWVFDRIDASAGKKLFDWILLGFISSLFLYGYTPIRILYPVLIAFVLSRTIYFFRGRRGQTPREALHGPGLALLIFGVIFLIQTSGPGGIERAFSTETTGLPVDSSIFIKESPLKGDVGEPQPTHTILSSLGENIVTVYHFPFSVNTLPLLYPASLVFVSVLSLLALFRSESRFVGAYFIFALLPPLLVYPLPRRIFLTEPIVYYGMAFVLFEFKEAAESLFRVRGWSLYIKIILTIGVSFALWSGIHRYFTDPESIIFSDEQATGPYRVKLMNLLRERVKTHHLYIVGSLPHGTVFWLSLMSSKLDNPSQKGFEMWDSPREKPSSYLRNGEPSCFVYFGLLHALLRKVPSAQSHCLDASEEREEIKGRPGEYWYKIFCCPSLEEAAAKQSLPSAPNTSKN